MKKSIGILAIAIAVFFVSCKSAQQKELDAQQNLSQARQDLSATQASNANEWQTFRSESLIKIKENDKRIAELKIKMNQPGNTFDGMYRTRIEKLEAKNKELKSKLKNYDGKQTDWKTFKSDFNRDMDEIGKNIKDLFR